MKKNSDKKNSDEESSGEEKFFFSTYLKNGK